MSRKHLIVLVISTFIAALFLSGCSSLFPTSNVVLVGNIDQSYNSSGNIVFLGNVKNIGDAGASNVYIVFNITIEASGLSGEYNSQIVQYGSLLGIMQTASFECATNIPSTEAIVYSYHISSMADWDL